MGGKRRLAPKILPLIPKHTAYVEPFAGAAAIFFIKEPSKVEVLNDVNGDITNLYRVAKHHLPELLNQFRYAITSRQIYEWNKQTPPETLTDIQRAARFYYQQAHAFGGQYEGSFGTATTAPPKFSYLRIEEQLAQAHERMARVMVESLDWYDCAIKYDRPHTVTYLDPPYWKTAGYKVGFPWEQYVRLEQFMAAAKGLCILSINDHPHIRELFKGYPMATADIIYTTGSASTRKPAKELIIGTWPDGFPKP